MTAEHFELSLRGMQRRTPFQSYTIEMMSGDHLVVDQPEAVVIRSGLAVFIDARGVPSLFDHESVARLAGEGQRASA